MKNAVSILVAVGVAAATSVAVATPAHATTPCKATLSLVHPRDNQNEVLTVRTTRSAKTYATIHYKSKNTLHSTIASKTTGVGTITFDISRATYGYRVVVDVTTSSKESCAAAFTPEK